MNYKKLKIKNVLVAITVIVFNISFLIFKLHAQQLPNTDIYLVPINQTDTGITLGGGRLITDMKRYDDYPSFSINSQYMYYTCEGEDYKTDIYAVYLPQFQNLEFISTGNQSEYAPLQKPDMTGLALIRDNGYDKSRQVWFYGTDGSDKCLTPDQKNIDTYAWLSDTTLALRLGGKMAALTMMNLKTNKVDTMVNDIGASVAKVPSENAVYYTTNDKGIERLWRYNYDTHKSDSLIYLPGGSKEFIVATDGSLWTANQGVIYRWPRAAAKWDMLESYNEEGTLGGAYRLAVSRDMKWLAVVTETKKY